MKFSFELIKKDKKTKARTGVITTANGVIKTPSFSPVATRASVRGLSIEDLINAKSQVVLANTYHLYLQPGTKVIKKFGGFAPYMGWTGPTITDSGGYQVSFLWTPKEKIGHRKRVAKRKVKITDEGAVFTSHIDGSRHLLTPEKSMQIQKDLGADITMAFDQPLGSNYSSKKSAEAFNRTLKWEERSFVAWKKLKSTQALFGIIQGDLDKKLREQSLRFILQMGFPGLAMGGESIGANPGVTAESLDLIADLLPDDKPLHTLGLGGGPEGIFEAVQRGMDTFDNTGITRMARTGLLFIYPEDGGKRENKFRVDVTKSKFSESKKPVSKICKCYACTHYSAGYISHLIKSEELLGLRLTSLHNVRFINDLMERIRSSIEENNFLILKKEWLG